MSGDKSGVYDYDMPLCAGVIGRFDMFVIDQYSPGIKTKPLLDNGFDFDAPMNILYRMSCRERCREFLESSITIANAALEAIRVDSRRSYGDGK